MGLEDSLPRAVGSSPTSQDMAGPLFGQILILFNFSALRVMHVASTSDLSIAGYTAITLGAASTASQPQRTIGVNVITMRSDRST